MREATAMSFVQQGASAPSVRSVLDHGQWFRALPDDLREGLLRAALTRTLQPDERLFSRGDPPCGLYAVVQGTVRITGVSHEGKEALLTLIEPPHWFGEISLFDGLPRTHDAIADTHVLVLQVPHGAVCALIAEQPERWHAFGVLLAAKMRLAFNAMEDLALLPAAVRVARRLLLIAEDYGERTVGSRRLIAVRQEQLAMMLSLSRQTTNQILRDLEDRGIARLTRGEIEIVDIDGLREAAVR